MTWETLGTRLAQLGGADLRLIPKVPSAKGRFIQMGLVLVSTAGLAVVSMTFALIDGLKASPWLAVPGALVWGFIILNIDRLLVQNIKPGNGPWRTIAVVVPRLVVAALLGMVIAIPLTLQIFDSEIKAEMQRENAQNINQIAKIRSDSPEAKRLAVVDATIRKDQDILNGKVPTATSPNVQAAQAALTRANQDLTAKRQAAQDAYARWRCELDGSLCNGGSGKVGDGPRAKALRRAYDTAAGAEADAQQAVAAARRTLDDANARAATANTTSVQEAQDQARRELPGALKERDQLNATLAQEAAKDNSIESGSTGLLARIQALNTLSGRDSSAFWAHWAVAALLFMIELLPVLVKFLTTLGPPSLYDRISDLEDDTSYDNATWQRNDSRRKIEQDSKKTRDIEDDMRARETALGIKANKHVAQRMEAILDVALEQWGEQVSQTLHAAGTAANGHDPTRRISTQAGPGTSSDAVRSQYGLPKSETL
jgi:Domain of unknown function (DUF4407)